MVAPTLIPNLKGWGLYAINPKELILDANRRPVKKPITVFQKRTIIGGVGCYFVGELVTERELSRRYAGYICGDYVLEGDRPRQFIDGQVGRTVLQFSNDAINLGDRDKRRNLPDKIVMPNWPVIQNAEGVKYGQHIYLVALTDINHGDEIYWSYSGDPVEEDTDYWTAPNHQ